MFKRTDEIINLVINFQEKKLTRAEWTHEVFLAVALYYCLRFPFGRAIELMRRGLRNLGQSHRTSNNYNETLTMFWLITIKQFIETSESYSLTDLANELIVFGNADLPFSYYSWELLFSSDACDNHVQPDLDRFYLFANLAKLTASAEYRQSAVESFIY